MSRTLKLVIRDRTSISCQLVVLDLDDTLVSTKKTAYRKTRALAQRLGLPNPRWQEFFKHYKAKEYPEYIRSVLGIDMPLEEIVELYEKMHEKVGGYELVTGVSDFLQALCKAQIPIIILTNAPSFKVPEKTELINKYISELCCCGDQKIKKPDPACFLPIKEKYSQIPNQNIVLIGDSLVDYQTALNSNLVFIAVQTGLHNRQDFEKAGLDKKMIIRDLTEIQIVKSQFV